MLLQKQNFSEDFRELREWFSRPAGSRLLEAEQRVLIKCSEYCQGQQIVVLGGSTKFNDLFRMEGSSGICYINPFIHEPGSMVITADPEKLPVQSAATDCLFIHHTLELLKKPHQILREADRILMPGGRLIICGFNPYSIWSFWRFISPAGRIARKMNYQSIHKIKDWLRLLSFDPDFTRYCAPGFPFDATFHFLNNWQTFSLSRWKIGAVYFIVAIKEEFGLIPVDLAGENIGNVAPYEISPIWKVRFSGSESSCLNEK